MCKLSEAQRESKGFVSTDAGAQSQRFVIESVGGAEAVGGEYVRCGVGGVWPCPCHWPVDDVYEKCLVGRSAMKQCCE